MAESEGEHGTWAMLGLDLPRSSNSPGNGPYRKRAYINAKRRAMQYGGTWYRNQWLQLANPPAPQPWIPPPRSHKPRGRRLKILSWNARTLTVELWQELQTYVRRHQFDLVFIQSTCWTFASNWTAQGYHVAHTGTPDEAYGGLLTMISQKLGAADEISVGAPLEMRLRTHNLTFDFLNVYQHPWRQSFTQEQNLTTRQEVWDAIHESLTHLPFRNRLVFAGDFNTSLITEAHDDSKEFKQIIQHHSLGSLMQSQPNRATFYSVRGNSQIDFVFGRQCHLDSHAKCGTVDTDTPLAIWREAADHLICNMPFTWCPWRRKPQKIQSAIQTREMFREHARQDTPTWQQLCKTTQQDLLAMPTNPEILEQVQPLLLSRIASKSSRPHVATAPRKPS